MSNPALSRLVFAPRTLQKLGSVQGWLSGQLGQSLALSRSLDPDIEELEAQAEELREGPRYQSRRMAQWLSVDVPVGTDLKKLRRLIGTQYETEDIWRQNLYAALPSTSRDGDDEEVQGDYFEHSRGARGLADADTGLALVDAGWDSSHPLLQVSGTAIVREPYGAPNPVHVHHGTRSLCTAVGQAGIAPHVRRVCAISSLDKLGYADHVRGLARALRQSRCGDVILLEVQDQFPRAFNARETLGGTLAPAKGRLAPAEVDVGVQALIALATRLGITVIEPSGNGGLRVPGPIVSGGAVVVGAASIQGPVAAAVRSSNTGPAVAVYGPNKIRVGSTETNALTGERYYGPAVFGNTSAAAAAIAGLVLVVQGMARVQRGHALTVEGVRALLARGGRVVEQGVFPNDAEMLANIDKYPLQVKCA